MLHTSLFRCNSKLYEMKKLLLSVVYLAITISLSAQANFCLGVKGGVNFSKISFDKEDYSSEYITKTHLGAFLRLGCNRVFIQPEVYYSGKGGEITDAQQTLTSFDYNSVDVPLLLGIKLINGNNFNMHIVGGPVFSGILTKDVSGGSMSHKSFYDDYFYGYQYGLGIDFLFLTLDARMENGVSELYSDPTIDGKNQTFMLSLGLKFF